MTAKAIRSAEHEPETGRTEPRLLAAINILEWVLAQELDDRISTIVPRLVEVIKLLKEPAP